MEANAVNNKPDLLDIQFYLKRVGRGFFVIDGSITVGADLTDETMVSAEVFYSPSGQNYMRTPFVVKQMTLSDYFNTFYKDLFLETYMKCSTNLPMKDKSDTFVPPLTKRVMDLENCEFSNDEMPSHMKSGFYNVTIAFTNQVESYMIVLAKVEPK